MKEINLPTYLHKIGRLIEEGWKKLANKYELNISILPPNALATFTLNYTNSLELKTLFTQEMLKRQYLSTPSVYVSYKHNEDTVKEYLGNVDEVFEI